jgi:quinol-cytochrome oxidoreductase complex cytochrome b subunit
MAYFGCVDGPIGAIIRFVHHIGAYVFNIIVIGVGWY